MGYTINTGPLAGRYSGGIDIGLSYPSLPFTAAGTFYGPVIEVGSPRAIELVNSVTAAAGTSPTLDITIEGSRTGAFGGEQRTLATFAQATGVTSQALGFVGSRFIRAKYVVGGSGGLSISETLQGELDNS